MRYFHWHKGELILIICLGALLLCPSAVMSEVGWREYCQAVATHTWSVGWEVMVSNRSDWKCSHPVVLEVDRPAVKAYAVVDETGLPVPSQTEDLDGDGSVDRLVFVGEVPAITSRKYQVLTSRQPLVPLEPFFTVSEEQHGSWIPLRFHVTTDRQVIPTHYGQYSPYNRKTVGKLIDSLEDKKAMTVIRGPQQAQWPGRPVQAPFQLTVGNESGLIESMLPHAMRGYAGSSLREFVPHWQPSGGQLQVVANGPVRVVLRWRGIGSREIVVYRNGRVETEWVGGPRWLQIISGAHPYRFFATDPQQVVRYSLLIDRMRSLPDSRRCALFGYHNASLVIDTQNLKPVSEQIWPDPGEIFIELALRAIEAGQAQPRNERFPTLMAMKERCHNYLAGGYNRVVTYEAQANFFRIVYKIGERGEQVLQDLAGPQVTVRVTEQADKAEVNRINTPPAQPAVTVTAMHSYRVASRLYPNEFNGWKLRPLKLAQENPHPVFYRLTISNSANQPREVALAVDLQPWMREVTLQHEPIQLRIDTHPTAHSDYSQEVPISAEHPVQLLVPAQGSTTAVLRVFARADTVGLYDFRLDWSASDEHGSLPLTVEVRPDQLFAPIWSGWGVSVENEDVLFDYLNVKYVSGPWRASYGYDRDDPSHRWTLATWRDIYRGGFFIFESWDLRQYITYQHQLATEPTPKLTARDEALDRFLKPPPHEFVRQLKQMLKQTAPFNRYRTRVYLADEIWEILGGYKGRYWMPMEEAADFFEEVVMNCPNPAYNSFQVPGADADFDYLLANDIPQIFHYTAQDSDIHHYALGMIDKRQRRVAQWLQDPAVRAAVGTDQPQVLYSFWISSILHDVGYRDILRQLWWMRANGIDVAALYAGATHTIVSSNMAGFSSTMSTGTDGLMITDRGLATIEGRQDWALQTLAKMLRDQAQGPQRSFAEERLQQAWELSQAEEFDHARHLLVEVVKRLRPDLLPLCPADYYRPVSSFPLPEVGSVIAQAAKQAATRLSAARQANVPQISLHCFTKSRRSPPVIDGKLDNAYIEDGVQLGTYILASGNGAAKAQTMTYLGYDDNALYLFMECTEPQMEALRALVTEADGNVWDDDCIEVFVAPQSQEGSYYQIVVNSLGVVFDRFAPSKADNRQRPKLAAQTRWDCDGQIAVRKTGKAWIVEMRLPWASFGGPPKPGTQWRMNFCRERYTQPELSCWSCPYGSFLNQQQFGCVKFEG